MLLGILEQYYRVTCCIHVCPSIARVSVDEVFGQEGGIPRDAHRLPAQIAHLVLLRRDNARVVTVIINSPANPARLLYYKQINACSECVHVITIVIHNNIILGLGIIREPTLWSFITSKYSFTQSSTANDIEFT